MSTKITKQIVGEMELELEKFVTDTCGHRNPSHSHVHMQDVKNMATYIYDELYDDCHRTQPLYFFIIIVAWLHDVCDHKYIKYEPKLLDKMDQFLDSFTLKYTYLVKNTVYQNYMVTKMIKNIIERISFSRERDYGDNDWNSTIGLIGIIIRNIVSDADKLMAIGKNGIQRAREYNMEEAEKNDIHLTNEQLNQKVVEHYYEKLKLLGDMYIKTKPAKNLAIKLNKEMADEIQNLI